MKTVIANRADFFQKDGCPVALRTIQGDSPVQHEGDLTDIRHTHDFSELIIITGGGGDHWINGVSYPVSAGDIFLIQGNTEHYFKRRHNLEMFNIMFDDSYLKEHLHTLRSLSGFNAFFLFEPTYRRSHKFQSRLHIAPETMLPLKSELQRMLEESRHRNSGFDLILLAKALEIFVFISREYSQVKNPKARTLCRLGEVISMLEKRYKEPWTIARISRIASMAPSTLLPVFKKVTGYSPIDYLLHVRLSKAAEQLLQTELAISDIAAECGFPDSNYFARQFKKCYDLSPRDYRMGR
ncbi:MAG: helix-turn-helix domain-containing protein [Lentisphaeria bacterium]|nr:helix-turn-helix domain-containing protein [Lentisphaeria bacterium]